jgi:hypothetical protein
MYVTSKSLEVLWDYELFMSSWTYEFSCLSTLKDAIIHSCFENFLDHNIFHYF